LKALGGDGYGYHSMTRIGMTNTALSN